MSPQQHSVSPQSVAQLDAQANVEVPKEEQTRISSLEQKVDDDHKASKQKVVSENMSERVRQAEKKVIKNKLHLVSKEDQIRTILLSREVDDDRKAAEQKVVSGSMSERVSQAEDRLMRKLHILEELRIKFTEVLEKPETYRDSSTCAHFAQLYIQSVLEMAASSSSKVDFDGIGLEDGLPSLINLQNKVQNDFAKFIAEARRYYAVLGKYKFWEQQFSYFDPPYVSGPFVPKVLGPSAIKPMTTMIRHRKRKLQNASQMKFVSECIKRDPRSAELSH